MYEQYLSMPSVPAGAILKRILKKANISQRDIAAKTSLYPQRINDLICGKRRFTLESSFRLEQALGLTHRGYFYIIQSNNAVYTYIEEQERKNTPDLTKIRKVLFWEAPSLEAINWKRQSSWIIQRAFEYGNHDEIKEIIRYYGCDKIVETLNKIPNTDTWKLPQRTRNRKLFGI